MHFSGKEGAAANAAPAAGISGRRRFMAGVAGGVLAGFPMIASAQKSTVLRLHGAWSAKDIFHEYALDFAKKINDMAGNRLRVDVLPAGSTVKPQDLQDAVHRGTIDGCHAVSGMWHSRNHAFSLFGAGPAPGMDANVFLGWMRYGGGMELYAELVHRQLNLNVVPFFTGAMPPRPLGWFRKPVKSPEDLKGLRVRSSGMAAELLREMGATPVAFADEDVPAAMKRSEIDAAQLNNPSTDRGLGMPDAAKTCMLRSYHQTAEVFEVLINRSRFNALPAEVQAMVRHAADAASADLSWKALQRYPGDHAAMRDGQGVQFLRTPATVLRAQLKAWEALIGRTGSTNPFFDKIWKSQLAWSRRCAGWTRENTPDAALAQDFWLGSTRRKPKA
ncbi:MAG: TRAP transporter substrate-binding protein [Burkholderiales bacterium]